MSDFPPPHQHQGYSNYSRATYVPNPPDRPPGIYFDYISKAWNVVNTNLTTWILATLILLVVTYGVNLPLSFLGNYLAYGSALGAGFPGGASRTPSTTGILISLGFSLLGAMITYPIQAGIFYMAVKQVRGIQVSPGEIFSGYSRAGHVVLANIIMGLLIGVSFLLLIVPSFYVTGALGLRQVGRSCLPRR